MAINFPHNPNVNDVHTESSLGKSWRWDGTTWLIYSSSTTGIGYSDLSVTTEAAQGGGSLTYNQANGQFTFKPSAGGGGGATNFTGLGDTPSTLTAGKWLKVNTGGTALEWTDAPSGNDTNDYLNTASLSGTTLTLTRTGSQSLSDVTVNLSSLNSVPTNITVANESTDIECYPLFTTEATGNLAPKTVTSFKLNSSSGQLEAGSFKKTGGASTEFLKADGSTDSTTYLSSAPSYALNDLSNVDAVTGVANGKIIKYNGTSWEVADDQSGGGGATTLGALTDVDTTGAVNNKILKYNGTSWVVADDATGGGGGSSNFTGLADTPSSLQADKWVKVNTGATALEFANAPALTNLTDVTISGSPGDDSILQFDSTDSKWKPASLGNTGNTTYTLTAVQGGTSVNIRLTGSDSTEDNVLLTPGSGLSLASITVDGFTINSTDTLDTITGRGATTNNDVTVGSITCDNLTVNGTTTTVNSNTVNIGDNILVLNSDETGTPSQNGGLEIERGTSTNVSLRWNETTDKWQYTNDGTNFSNIGFYIDSNTTYSVSCVDGDNADEEKIRLTAGGSGSGTDDVVLEAGTGLSVARSGDKITFTNTVSAGSDTTYDMRTAAVTGGGIIRLENELDNTTDDIQILGGTSITVDRSADHKLTINSDITNLTSLSDVTISGSVPNDSILQFDTGDNQWKPVGGDSVGTTIPAGTIVMYNGTTAPSGWALCDGGGSRPDLRDKFVVGAGSSYNVGANAGSADAVVVSHNHGSGNSGNQSANHTHGSGNYSGNTSTHNGHTHDDGNYDAALNGSHTHQANISGNTGNQSANHYHTIGGNKPDGSPGTWNATASGGTHGHSYRESNGHPQSNMAGIQRSGGDDSNLTNNTDILSSGGSHNHNVNLTGVTTGGIDQNHSHSMNFNVNTSPPLTQSEHSHNVSGNSGSGGNHSHNVNFSGSSGNQSANHTHSIDSEGVSGSGKNLPPYYAITFIIKL